MVLKPLREYLILDEEGKKTKVVAVFSEKWREDFSKIDRKNCVLVVFMTSLHIYNIGENKVINSKFTIFPPNY
jgi:hypothetical protein